MCIIKESWMMYDHKKITNWIAEMIALASQLFSIVEDANFLHLLGDAAKKILFRKDYTHYFFQ